MALDFYIANAKYYTNSSSSPKFQLEPHVALELFQALLSSTDVELFEHALVQAVTKNGTTITSIELVDGRVFEAGVFIEADYEGDLMARANVSYAVGRESRDAYNESLAGYRTSNAGHEFSVSVSPVDDKGTLLPMVNDWVDPAAVEGQGDAKVQSYNFRCVEYETPAEIVPHLARLRRLCVTTDPNNSISFTKPAGYDPTYWELARR